MFHYLMKGATSGLIVLLVSSAVVAPLVVSVDTQAAMTQEQKDQKKADRAAAKADRKFNKSLSSIAKTLANYDKQVENKSYVNARKRLDKAKKRYKKVEADHSDRLSNADVIKLKSRLDEAELKLTGFEKSAEESRVIATIISVEIGNFGRYVEQYKGIYYWLSIGRHGKPHKGTVDNIDKLEAGLGAFLASESEFRKKFPNIIKHRPETKSNGVVVAHWLDAYKNSAAYKKSYASIILSYQLQKSQEALDKSLADLSRGLGWNKNLDYLYQSEDESFGVLSVMKPYYQNAGLPLPEKELEKIAAYFPKMKDTIKDNLSEQEFEKMYGATDGDLEDALEEEIERQGMELEDYRLESGWTVVKNALGVPLYRKMRGFAFFNKDGEPFNRGCVAEFVQSYGVSEFSDVTKVTVRDGYGLYED